jgi:hypothetical protein
MHIHPQQNRTYKNPTHHCNYITYHVYLRYNRKLKHIHDNRSNRGINLRISPFPWSRKILPVRHVNSFEFVPCQWHTRTSLTVHFLPAAGLCIFSEHRLTFLLNEASYVKCSSMGKNWHKTEHTWTIRMSSNDWTVSWWLMHS